MYKRNFLGLEYWNIIIKVFKKQDIIIYTFLNWDIHI